MPNILNLTLPLKQDAASQAKLAEIGKRFTTDLWPDVSKVLKDSKMVYYARFVLIGTKYLQVLTEYDADFQTYTKFFAERLSPFFKQVFDVVDGAPDPSKAGDPDELFRFVKSFDLPSLGGVCFSAFGDLTVKEIQQKCNIT